MKDLQKQKIALMKERKDENKPIINIINDILTGFKTEAVNQKTTVENLTDKDKMNVIKSVSKKLKQEIEGLKSANRDFSSQVTQENFVHSLLPKTKSEDEVSKEIDELITNGAKTIGNIMKHFKGKDEYNLQLVSKLAKEKL